LFTTTGTPRTYTTFAFANTQLRLNTLRDLHQVTRVQVNNLLEPEAEHGNSNSILMP